MGIPERVSVWHPGTLETGWAPECQFDLHQFCSGNADLFVQGVRYDSLSCGCACHPPREVRRIDWPQAT